MAPSRSALHARFGAEVRAARVARGLSQEELGSRSGLNRSYVGGVERGERNPTLMNMGRIADALEMPLADLMPPTDLSE